MSCAYLMRDFPHKHLGDIFVQVLNYTKKKLQIDLKYARTEQTSYFYDTDFRPVNKPEGYYFTTGVVVAEGVTCVPKRKERSVNK